MFYDFIKNPQTTIALTFLTHIISGIGGVNKHGVKIIVLVGVLQKSKKFEMTTAPCFQKFFSTMIVLQPYFKVHK